MTAFNLPPSDLLKHFDSDLQKFYCNVLAKELDVRNRRNTLKIRRALKEVVEAYKKEYGKDSSPSIRFNSPARRCAYVLKHSPCFTSAVAKHFLKLLRSNSLLLQRCLVGGELNLCCLGGGPASDAVAISKVISALHLPFWLQTKKTLKFKITIVDINEDWEITAKNVLDIMKGSDDFFGVKGMEMKFQFCQADLTYPFEAKVKQALKSADVVTMVFFLSAVNRCVEGEESLRMVQKIMRNMKNGAVVFFLDSAKSMNYNQMDEAADTLGNLEQIYGPHLEDFHTLSLNSVRIFLDLYKKDFGRLLCMTNCFVSTSAWAKLDTIQRITPLSETQSDLIYRSHLKQILCHRSDMQKASNLTKKMLDFRAKVQKLLEAEFDKSKSDESGFEDLEEDPFETLLRRHFEFVPKYFFQTKEKKRRIFTGPPLSI
ncbi:unnamed protein product [Larinioides sclopetarius]|uniref:Uncharacterized protein n=1 Tax=Larinioides sclopetarius TaxID=280406 RepID=A0AAV1ZS84_9ARAC